MRRVASKAKDAMEPAERAKAGRASVRAPYPGVRGVGDLIEMTDEFEIGGDEDEEDGERGRRGSEVHVGAAGKSSSSSGYFSSNATTTSAGKRERSEGQGGYLGKGKDD